MSKSPGEPKESNEIARWENYKFSFISSRIKRPRLRFRLEIVDGFAFLAYIRRAHTRYERRGRGPTYIFIDSESHLLPLYSINRVSRRARSIFFAPLNVRAFKNNERKAFEEFSKTENNTGLIFTAAR